MTFWRSSLRPSMRSISLVSSSSFFLAVSLSFGLATLAFAASLAAAALLVVRFLAVLISTTGAFGSCCACGCCSVTLTSLALQDPMSCSGGASLMLDLRTTALTWRFITVSYTLI
jgi:hypothetical protein